MSSNFFAFSTAPNAHPSGVLGPTSGNNNGSTTSNSHLADGMLSPLGAASPGSLLSTSSGSGMLPHSSPLLPQPQPQPQHVNRLNPGLASMPQPYHPHPGAGPTVGAGSGNGAGGVRGPAVPAPRSAATLIAEVTGAPPPPPLPASSTSALGTLGSAAGMGTSANPPHVNMATLPAAQTGLSTPVSLTSVAAAAMVGSGGSTAAGTALPVSPAMLDAPTTRSVASLASPSFTAFTTSAATMLSAQGVADAAAMHGCDGGMLAADTASAVPLPDAGRGVGRGAVTPTSPTTDAGLSPYSHVEVQLTLANREHDDSDASEDRDAAPWDPTLDEDDALDMLGYIFASLGVVDDECDVSAATCFSVDEGKRDGFDLFRFHDLRKSAALMHKLILDSQHDRAKLRMTLKKLAFAIIAYRQYQVILQLSKRDFWAMRFGVVQHLMSLLFYSYREDQNGEVYIKDLLELVYIGLVSVKSLVSLIDGLLMHKKTEGLALRLLMCGLANGVLCTAMREALEGVPRIAQRLLEIRKNHPYEMDVVLLTRLWQRAVPALYGSVSLQTPFRNRECPVTCMAYFGVRDELVSGHMNGSVVLWGGPTVVREKHYGALFAVPRPVIRSRGVVPLPLDCVPVAMAGQRIDGQYLAIAGMPYKTRKPYKKHCEKEDATPQSGVVVANGSVISGNTSVGGGTANRSAAAAPPQRCAEARSAAAVGTITIITCNENSIRWNKGEVIQRPAGVALTAITAFRNSIVAVGESVVQSCGAGAAPAASPHRLSFVDVTCGTVMRQILNAHDDYITSLNVLDEGSYVLLSGGRDAAVKLWDPRSREESPVVNTALCTAESSHCSTITAMCTAGYNILSTAVDGSLLMWDLRSMEAPQLRRELGYPIVDAALIERQRAVVATSRGIIAVSLDSLEPLDMYFRHSAYSHVVANMTGELLFTASAEGDMHCVIVTK